MREMCSKIEGKIFRRDLFHERGMERNLRERECHEREIGGGS